MRTTLPIPRFVKALSTGDRLTLLPVVITLVLWVLYRGVRIWREVY